MLVTQQSLGLEGPMGAVEFTILGLGMLMGFVALVALQ
jgi:hypothetical protein